MCWMTIETIKNRTWLESRRVFCFVKCDYPLLTLTYSILHHYSSVIQFLRVKQHEQREYLLEEKTVNYNMKYILSSHNLNVNAFMIDCDTKGK